MAHHSVAMAEREAKRQKTEKDMFGSSRPVAGLYIPKMEDSECVVDKRGQKVCVAPLLYCDHFRIYLDPRNFCDFPSADTRIDFMCTTSIPPYGWLI